MEINFANLKGNEKMNLNIELESTLIDESTEIKEKFLEFCKIH